MKELITEMKVTLASVFSFYLKTHNYHWNVTGPDFAQYHDFLGKLYEEVWDSVDLYAEHIRPLNSYDPGSLGRFSELSLIADETTIPSGVSMMSKLAQDNTVILEQLYKTVSLAEMEGKRGIINFLEGQIDYHDKLAWMLSSFNK